jgi:hypothetical protein
MPPLLELTGALLDAFLQKELVLQVMLKLLLLQPQLLHFVRSVSVIHYSFLLVTFFLVIGDKILHCVRSMTMVA